nr:MAG TPA: LexA-like protein [Bacteriophage sp.]
MPLTAEQISECEKLKSLFAEKSDISQREFASRYKIGTPGNLWQYLNGRRPLNLEVAIKIADGLGISVEDFSERLSRQRARLTSSNVAPERATQKKIPILSYVQAGDPNGGDEVARATAIENGDYVFCDEDVSDEAYALIIQGRSMEPDFAEGDKIIIDPTLAPNAGDFVVARRDDPLCDSFEITFKKYRLRGYDQHGREIFELIPLNSDYPTYRSDVDHLAVIGVAVEHKRKLR